MIPTMEHNQCLSFLPRPNADSDKQTTMLNASATTFSPSSPKPRKTSMKDHTCYYWLHSDCKYAENDCLYAHRYTGKVAEKPVRVQKGRPSVAGTNARSGNPIYRHWRAEIGLLVPEPEEFREQLHAISMLADPHRAEEQREALKDNIIRGQQSMLNTCLLTLSGTTDTLRQHYDEMWNVDRQTSVVRHTSAQHGVQEALKTLSEQNVLLALLKEAKQEVAMLLKQGGLGQLVNTEE